MNSNSNKNHSNNISNKNKNYYNKTTSKWLGFDLIVINLVMIILIKNFVIESMYQKKIIIVSDIYSYAWQLSNRLQEVVSNVTTWSLLLHV